MPQPPCGAAALLAAVPVVLLVPLQARQVRLQAGAAWVLAAA